MKKRLVLLFVICILCSFKPSKNCIFKGDNYVFINFECYNNALINQIFRIYYNDFSFLKSIEEIKIGDTVYKKNDNKILNNPFIMKSVADNKNENVNDICEFIESIKQNKLLKISTYNKHDSLFVNIKVNYNVK